MITLFTKLLTHLRDGSGIHRFLLWLRDAVAFEQRDDPSIYQRWLRERIDSTGRVDVHGDGGEHGILTVSVPRQQEPFGNSVGWLNAAANTDKKFILFTHPDAVLTSFAVRSLLQAAESSQADIIYSDEDQIGCEGYFNPRLKPGFSIDLLRVEDYIGPIFLARTEIVRLVFVSYSPAGCDSYGLLLSAYENGAQFFHVSDVLVHWRFRRSSSLDRYQRDIVKKHLIRFYGPNLARRLAGAGRGMGDSNDLLVSIIIPTRDRLELVSKCVESIYSVATHIRYEVILIDNKTEEVRAKTWLAEAPSQYTNLRVLPAVFPFNWSKLNNLGAREATGGLLLFLNNDVEVISDFWLDKMSANASRLDVGAVGTLLLRNSDNKSHSAIALDG